MSARDLKRADKILTGIGYVAYPALLIFLLVSRSWLIVPCIVVPAVVFSLITLLRRIINAERPYEASATPNLLDKQTHGRSFPSRHVASMFIIAASWLLINKPIGMGLCILGCIMAAIRVKGGAHHVQDVVAGAVLGFALCAVGYAIAYALQPLI